MEEGLILGTLELCFSKIGVSALFDSQIEAFFIVVLSYETCHVFFVWNKTLLPILTVNQGNLEENSLSTSLGQYFFGYDCPLLHS